MSSDVEESESDGTSADTILRELCMLRCSSCRKSSLTSVDNSNLDSVNISSFFVSDVTSTRLTNSRKDTDLRSTSGLSCPNKKDQSSGLGLSINYTEHNSSSLFNSRWFKNVQEQYHRVNSSLESSLLIPSPDRAKQSFSRGSQVSIPFEVNSTGTDPPNFDGAANWIVRADWGGFKSLSDRSQQTAPLSPKSDRSSSFEYLVRQRCNSPDCACDKRFSTSSRVRKRRGEKRALCVGSQVTKTSAGLRLSGWDGDIVIRESSTSSLDVPSLGGSDESLPSLLALSVPSSSPSYSAFKFLKRCSDKNLLKTLGLKREDGSFYSMGSTKLANENKNRGQMVDTYGKLLHKIEKLKKMTWKSKKRKNKLKYTLEGANFQEDNLDNINICIEVDNKQYHMDSGGEKVTEMDYMCSGDATAVLSISKEEPRADGLTRKAQETVATRQIRTTDIGIQSAKSESYITTVESCFDHIHLKNENKENDIKEAVSQINKSMLEVRNDKKAASLSSKNIRRDRKTSAASIGSCSLLKGMDQSVLSFGRRETHEEILQHLKQINRLIEREPSCTSNSTHRLCKSERSLGFEADKGDALPRNHKIERNSVEATKRKREARVYWAVTKVTVYPDSCRTYEVMKLSRKKPENVPTSSETVFVLLPNK